MGRGGGVSVICSTEIRVSVNTLGGECLFLPLKYHKTGVMRLKFHQVEVSAVFVSSFSVRPHGKALVSSDRLSLYLIFQILLKIRRL